MTINFLKRVNIEVKKQRTDQKFKQWLRTALHITKSYKCETDQIIKIALDSAIRKKIQSQKIPNTYL